MKALNQCIFCLEKKALTDEHIILKGLGGGLTAKLLCKECNSQFGNGLDASFLNQLPIRLARYIEGIAGRSRRLTGPFEGEKGKISNQEVSIVGGKDLDCKIVSQPKVIIDGNKIKVRAAFPQNASKEYIRESIRNAIKNGFEEMSPTIAEDEINRRIEEALKNLSEQDFHKQSSAWVEYNSSINVGVLMSAYEKIAYELTSMLFGEDYYLRSTTAKVLRDEILAEDGEERHQCNLFPKIPFITDLFGILSRRKLHAVIMTDWIAYITIFGIHGLVILGEGPTTRTCIDAKLFTFTYDEKYDEHNFFEWVDAEKNKSKEVADLLQGNPCWRFLTDVVARMR